MAFVKTTSNGLVARVEIQRPEVHNAIDDQVIAELTDAFHDLSRRADARVAVLASEGATFCAGADLRWMAKTGEAGEEENRRDAEAIVQMLRAVSECPMPVVARVQGNALGGGAGLVAAADIAIASEAAQFAFSEVRLGLVPATVAPYVIAKIGASRALSLFLTGRRFSAAEAFEFGLVHRVVATDDLDAALDEDVEALLQGGPQALREAKQLVRRVAGTPPAEVDSFTSNLIASLRAGDEGREGMHAFLEKRRPNWIRPD